MEQLTIKEAVHHVRRHSHRAKNAGNYSLFQHGKKVADKIRRAKNADSALKLESEYLEMVKKEYAVNAVTGLSFTRKVENIVDGY
jgi:predicted Ser/Thr protein kinase